MTARLQFCHLGEEQAGAPFKPVFGLSGAFYNAEVVFVSLRRAGLLHSLLKNLCLWVPQRFTASGISALAIDKSEFYSLTPDRLIFLNECNRLITETIETIL